MRTIQKMFDFRFNTPIISLNQGQESVFKICKFGYLSTSEVETVVNRTVSNGIPFDVAWVDINYANGSKDFTLNKTSFGDLPAYADYLHSQNMKLIVIVDPGIAVDYEVFERGLQQGASFIEWASSELVPNDVNGKYPLTNNTNLMLGAVWPLVHVAFPDFLDPTGNTTKWWINEFTAFHQMLPVDGIWIDMNEPSNCPGCIPLSNFGINPHLKGLSCPMTGNWSEYDNPPYLTAAVYLYPEPNVKTFLWTNTLCLNGISMRGQSNLFHTKSLYGWSMMRATHEVQKEVIKKRGLLLSRSTFAGAGQFGAHWLGDGWANFSTMALSMIGVQEFNMFGIPLIGADVCGFNGDTTEELCLRWQQLGAFYTFFRNHNDVGLPPKDPGLWPTVAAAARKSNLFRYRHLPYLYSLLFNAHINGGTVARPVFFEFPNDPLTYDLSFQFMWGSAMIVVPVITKGANYSVGYLPSSAIWYSLYDYFYGSKIDSGIQSEFPAPWNYMLPVFVRAGNIIPRQRPTTTTTATRQNEFQLLVALDVDNSQNLVAKGELYWDDGETLIDNITTYNYYHFEYTFSGNNNSATLNISMTRQAQNLSLPTLDNIEVFGYAYSPNIATAKLNGNPVKILSSSYSPFTQILNISSPALIDLNNNRPNWILTWNNVGVANEKDGTVGDKTGNADRQSLYF